jgi:hypothetical protein
MTTVRKPRSASPLAKAALVVVLPTPPFPEVTTIILAMSAVSDGGNYDSRGIICRASLSRYTWDGRPHWGCWESSVL